MPKAYFLVLSYLYPPAFQVSIALISPFDIHTVNFIGLYIYLFSLYRS